MLQAQKKGLSKVLEEIKKVYCKAFPIIRRWWDEGILSTYKKAINKLDVEIDKFNYNYNSKLIQAITPKFNIYYIETKMAAVKN
jgi:hypothetical protein